MVSYAAVWTELTKPPLVYGKISAVDDLSVRDTVMSKQESTDLLEETCNNLYESLHDERIFSSLNDDADNQV